MHLAVDIAKNQPADAARLVTEIISAMQKADSNLSTAAAGMPVLHKAGMHTDIVQVRGFCSTQIQPGLRNSKHIP